jgi:LysM repeat protein
MGDPTRGGPPRDDPEATQLGAPPEDALGEGAGPDAGEPADAWTWAATGAPEPTRSQPAATAPATGAPPTSAAASTRQMPPRSADEGVTRRAYTSYGAAPGGTARVKTPRRRGPRVTVARVVVPIVFLAAVIVMLSLADKSGFIGGKEATKNPAAGATGKVTPKASASPVVKVRKFYRVRAGDTLSAIAIKFHTTESELLIINNLSSTTLRVGQRLKLPPPGQ